MEASRKFDVSTSPDRSPYTSGSHVMYGGKSLDRSSYHRENMGSPIVSSLPSLSRSLQVTQEDIPRFLQSLKNLDPKFVGPENKFQQLVELKKALNFVVANSQDNPASGSLRGRLLFSSSPEDLKNAKSALLESSNLARERFKIFSEALFVFKKFFPSILLRKRSRTDRTNTVPLNGRSGGGSRFMNIGSPGHALNNASEGELQKSEERMKNTKRARSSVHDVRANSLARHFTPLDRDMDVVRGAYSGVVLANEQRLPIENWEKSKMKKKRSGVKADVSPSTSSAKSADGFQELKQGMPQRLPNESLGFRSGTGNGSLGVRKLDGQLQQAEPSVRSSVARLQHEKASVFAHHNEKPSGEEGVKLKIVNKIGMQEDSTLHDPTSNTRLIATARASRSYIDTLSKTSPSSQQLISSDWEISQCSKKPSASGPTNKKRKSSAQSSSPPVAHWARQRPQKISRRRTNFLPVANTDETFAFDATSYAGNVNGNMFVKPLPRISAQQAKLKSERLSESEESGIADTKKERKKKSKNKMTHAKVDGRAGHNVKESPNLVFPAKKYKLIGVEELSNSDQRQGGISQSLASSRSLLPVAVKKLRNIGPKKQLRSSKTSLNKAERKTGCPPMRKLSDWKAYKRNRLYLVNAAADFGDDGKQELLAAVKAIVDPSPLSLYWRHMELIFKFTSEADIGFLKQQVNGIPVLDTPTTDANGAANCLNRFSSVENLAHTCLTNTPEEWISKETSHDDTFPLCQRLIAALITDEEEYENGVVEKMQLDSHEHGFQSNAELEFGALTHGSMGNIYPDVSKAPNVCSVTVTGDSFYEKKTLDKPDPESHMVSVQNFGGISSSGYSFDRLSPGSEMIPITETVESQYVNMPIGERLRLELQSVGIFPEQPEMREMDNEEVSQEIKHLCKDYNRKVATKRYSILNLLENVSQSKEIQERNFEQCALDKLVTITYGKYMASFRGKGASSKMTKQAALAFANRTLKHCQKYENTGKSCFDEPVYKDIFAAALNNTTEIESVDHITESESDRGCPDMLSEEPCSDKMKNGELLDVGSGAIITSNSPGTGRLHMSTTKGKRSDRDRNGKGLVSKNGTTKLGRPVGSNTGNRKSKVKAKQKTTQSSASVTGLRGKMSKLPKGSISHLSCEHVADNKHKKTEDLGIHGTDDPIVDISSLEVPGIDVDLGDQGQDLASWLSIDDDSLQGQDFMGLETPMDNLFDVNMMF